MLAPLYTFCQTDSIPNHSDSVWATILDGDTVLVMSPERGKIISNQLIEGDSCCSHSEYLEKKQVKLLEVIRLENLSVTTLKNELELSVLQQQKLSENLDLYGEKYKIQQDMYIQEKKKKTIWGITGTGVGVVGGIILGILISK